MCKSCEDNAPKAGEDGDLSAQATFQPKRKLFKSDPLSWFKIYDRYSLLTRLAVANHETVLIWLKTIVDDKTPKDRLNGFIENLTRRLNNGELSSAMKREAEIFCLQNTREAYLLELYTHYHAKFKGLTSEQSFRAFQEVNARSDEPGKLRDQLVSLCILVQERELFIRLLHDVISRYLVRMSALAIGLSIVAGLYGYLMLQETAFGKAWNWPFYPLVLFVGMLGGAVSAILSIQKIGPAVPAARAADVSRLTTLKRQSEPLILGAIFAALLLFIVNSGVIEGSLFPKFIAPSLPSSNESGLGILRDAIRAIYPASALDLIKAVVWSFVAGYSQTLVPGILGDLSKYRPAATSASSADKP